MHDYHRTPGASAANAGAAVHGELQGVGLASREGNSGGPGTRGFAAAADGCREGRLSYYTKRGIEASAAAAYRDNRRPVDACPYRPDFAPLEFEHWKACFLLEGGVW